MVKILVGSNERKVVVGGCCSYPKIVFIHVSGRKIRSVLVEFTLRESIDFTVAVDDLLVAYI